MKTKSTKAYVSKFASILFMFVFLGLSANVSYGQTILINPSGDGGFENGATFAANGWTVANDATNTWNLGTTPGWFTGTSGAYVSNNAGTTWAYSNGANQRSHFYKDVTFPAGPIQVNLSFDWRGNGNDGNWDNLQVYIADVSVTPTNAGPTAQNTTITSWPGYTNGTTGHYLTRVNGTAIPTTTTTVNYSFTTAQASYAAGQTKRIIFTWKNDNSGGENPPASVDNISLIAYTCFPPTAPLAGSLTNSGATISWTAPASGTPVGYEWKVVANGAGSNGTALASGTTVAPVVTDIVTGLNAATTYQFYVRSDCGSGNYSQWSAAGTFSTLCNTFNTFPFNETFESASPSRLCWSNIQVSGAANWTYAAGSTSNITAAQQGSLNARFVSQTGVGTPVTKLVSPVFDLTSLSNPRLTFYLGQPVWGADQNQTKVYYRISPSDPWVEIAHYTQNLSSWTQFTLQLPNPSSTYQVAFEGINNYGRANVIDNVVIEQTPTCFPPTALVLGAVTNNSAEISWTLPGQGAPVNYVWKVVANGAGPNGAAIATGNVSHPAVSATATGLSGNTTYQIYLRTDCGASDTSAFSEAVTFTTLCDPSNIPYVMPITGVTAPNLPTCVTRQNINNDASTWRSYGTGTLPGWTYPILGYPFNATNNANDWLFTQGVNLTGGVSYSVKFKYNNDGLGLYPEKLKVMYGTLPAAAQMTNLLADYPNVVNSTPQFASIPFTPASSGVYYVGFQAYSDADMDLLILDDISIELTPTCPSPTNPVVSAVTPSQATLSWQAPLSGTPANYIWKVVPASAGVNGTPIADGVVPAPTTSTVFSGFLADTNYVVYVRSECGGGDSSTWVTSTFKPSFTYCNPAPSSVDNSGITRVTMGTIDNATGTEPNNYGDYSNLVTNAVLGESFPISIQYTTGYTYGTVIWVDLNNNNVFEGSEILYYGLSSSASPTTLNASITIPSGTSLGLHRIRIGGTDSDGGTTDPCYTGTFAAFEDYTLNVIERPASPSSLTQSVITPSCIGGSALHALPAAPIGIVYYLQTSATDTSTATPFVGDSVIVATNGTYFVRAKSSVNSLWSNGAASVTVNNIPVAPLPPSPVADASPACLSTNLTVPAPSDPNVTFYWQGTTMGGTSTALNASSPLVVTASGTYYVSAFDASSNCWSNTNGVAVVIDTFVPSAPSTGPNASVCAGVSSVELTASTPAPGSVQAVFGTNIISSGEAPVVLNATVPAIPAGATVTSTQLVLTNVNAINGSWRSEIRVAVSGISTLPETQLSTLGSSGLISPDPVINIPNVPAAGGAITLTLTESFNDAGVNDATFGEAKIVVNYTIPPTTVTWWDAASAGTQMGSGSPLQTVGTGLLPNTNTPGTYTFYAQANSVACTSNRVPVTVTVNPLPVVDAGTAFTACPLSPITLTATGANTYVWNNGVTNGVAFPAPTVTTLYTVTGTDANGCSSTDTITVFALPATAVSISPSGPITTCQNQPVVLTANGPANGPAETITQWNFNNSDLIPNEGTGTILLVGGTSPAFASGSGSSDLVQPGLALNTSAYPAQGTNPKTAGVQMNVSTAGYSNINLTFDVRHSGTAANTYVVQYNPDITNVLSPWIDAQTLVYNTSGNFINNQTVNLSAFPAANNNPNLGVRIVSAFDQTSGTTYVGTTGAYGTGGTVRYDMVTFSGEPAGATYLWTGGATTQSITPTTSGTYVVTVTEPNGVCSGYDSVEVTINPVPTTTLNPVICDNQTYTLANGDVVNTTNIYTRTVPSVVTGCDSIVVVNLTVNPTYNNTVSATICSNETYTLANGTVVTAAGPYTVTVPSVANCDSTVTVNLTVLPAQLFNVSASICADEDYTLPDGTVVTAANTYTNTFTAANGCDSTIVTVLSVKPVFTSTQNPVICDGDLQTMPDGTTQGVQGTYVFPYTAINGCDSTITVNLTVNPVFTTNLTVDICAGDSYTLADGSIVNTTDIYTVTVPAITGCDSTVVVDLTVRPNYATNTTASICFGETYTLVNGVTVSQAGPYTAGTTSIYGCDSVVTVILTVNPVFNQTVNASICDGDDYKLPDGNVVTAQGSYTSNLQTVFGCDSIVVTNLTVNPLPVVNLGADQAILNPPVVLNAGVGFTTYDWSTGATTQTITVTQNGTYGVTVTNQFGCEGSDEVTIYFTASIANLGNNGGSINIFPNPATDVFTVNVNGYTDGGNLKLDLVNALGQVVRTEMVSNVNESFSKMIDVYDLAPGTYTLMVKGTSAEAALRLIIVK